MKLLRNVAFFLWCTAWPTVLFVSGEASFLTVLALCIAAATPACVRAYLEGKISAEKTAHERCHGEVFERLQHLSALHAFSKLESVAGELELLEDQLRRLPSKTFVSAHSLADGIRTRAQLLRRASPDPPSLEIGDLTCPRETDES